MEQEGYHVLKAYDGQEALDIMYSYTSCQGEPELHLLILDIMMPRLDGIHAMMKLRQKYSIPVILLSAKSEDTDKILGLNAGADDYITKPFNPLEVTARVKTQLRRYGRYNSAAHSFDKPDTITEYDLKGLIINRDTHKCTLYGQEISLTPIEFSILWYLCEHKGKVISSEELFEQIWGEKFFDNNNTVMSHIGRLREKLGEPARNPKFIKTVWGVGYIIE